LERRGIGHMHAGGKDHGVHEARLTTDRSDRNTYEIPIEHSR
jgi:hypothetical protein